MPLVRLASSSLITQKGAVEGCKRTVRALTKKLDGPVKTTSHWGQFNRDDTVKIAGERGLYAFIGHCENQESGESWVALFGGDKNPGGRRQFRYVDPSRVKPCGSKAQRKT